jgi:hypothetical protein
MKDILKSYFDSVSGKFSIGGIEMQSVGHTALDGLISLVITIATLLLGANYHIGGIDVTIVVVLALQALIKLLRKYVSSPQVSNTTS